MPPEAEGVKGKNAKANLGHWNVDEGGGFSAIVGMRGVGKTEGNSPKTTSRIK